MKKRLTKPERAQIAEMLVEGIQVSEIASRFNISIPTVYNQRTRLINEGLKISSKRGKKKTSNNTEQRSLRNDSSPINVRSFEEYRFLINGVSIRISAKAKDVFVSESEMRIEF
jgi:transposase